MQLGQVFCQPKNGGQMISIIAHNFSHFLQLHSLGRYMYYIISEKVKQTEEVALHKTHTPISTKRREELFLEPALTTSLHLQRSISELKSLLLLQGTIYILDRLFGSYTTMYVVWYEHRLSESSNQQDYYRQPPHCTVIIQIRIIEKRCKRLTSLKKIMIKILYY